MYPAVPALTLLAQPAAVPGGLFYGFAGIRQFRHRASQGTR
jgi:hypothetical protein